MSSTSAVPVVSIEVPLVLKSSTSTVLAPKVLNSGFGTDYSGTGTRLSTGNSTTEEQLEGLIDEFNAHPSTDALARVREARYPVTATNPSKGLGVSRVVLQVFDAVDARVSTNFDKAAVQRTFSAITPKVLQTVNEDRYKIVADLNLSAVALTIKDGKPSYSSHSARLATVSMSYNPNFNPPPQVNVDSCVAVAMAMKPYAAEVKKVSNPLAILKEDFELSRGTLTSFPVYVDPKGKTWTPLNYYIYHGGSSTGLLNKIAKWNTQSALNTKSFLHHLKPIFKTRDSSFDFQTVENELQALNKDARAGGWFMCLKGSDIQDLGTFGAEGASERTNATALNYHRALVLRIIRHFAPESSLAAFAERLNLPACTEQDLAQPVFIAPKTELVPFSTVYGESSQLKTRPYGIFSGALQALCSAYGQKDLLTFYEDSDCVSGVGVNYSWGDGPAEFYKYLLKLSASVAKTSSENPNGTFRIVVYGDDIVFITPKGFYIMDTTSADATINAEEMEFALSIVLPLRPGYEELGRYLRKTISEPNVVFGKRLYKKNPGLLLSGSYATSQIDIIALTSRYLLMILAKTGRLGDVQKHGFSWDLASYNPAVFADLPSQCEKMGFKCTVTHTKELIPRGGLAPLVFLSSRFIKVTVGKGKEVRKYLAFSPDHRKLLASLIHPKEVKKPLLIALRALGFAIMFPEYPMVYDACKALIMSVCPLELLANPPDVLVMDLTPEVNHALKVVAPIVAQTKALPSRERLLDFKFAGKPLEPVKPQLVAVDPKTKVVQAVPELASVEVEEGIDLMAFATGSWADEPLPGHQSTKSSTASIQPPPPKYDADKKVLATKVATVPVDKIPKLGKVGKAEESRIKKAAKEVKKYAISELKDLRTTQRAELSLDISKLFLGDESQVNILPEEVESGDGDDVGASPPPSPRVEEASTPQPQTEPLPMALPEIETVEVAQPESDDDETSSLLEELSSDSEDEELDGGHQEVDSAYRLLGDTLTKLITSFSDEIGEMAYALFPGWDPENPAEFLDSLTWLRSIVPDFDKAVNLAFATLLQSLSKWHHPLENYKLPRHFKLVVAHPSTESKGGLKIGERVYQVKHTADQLRKKYGDRMQFVQEVGWEFISSRFLVKKRGERSPRKKS